jgi:flagellar motor switch protein FliN
MTERNESYKCDRLRIWTDSLETLLSQLSTDNWKVRETALQNPAEAVVRFVVTDRNSPDVAQWFSFSSRDAATLLSVFLQEEILPSVDLAQVHREALEDFARQWCGLAATHLPDAGGELKVDKVSHEPVVDSPAVEVEDGRRSIALTVQKQAKCGQEPHAMEETADSGNLAVLMDVELEVMLRFGRRQMLLRDVLELSAGSVLELDRQIQEPVELVLNHRVIAKGEVVVVDGNYGLRISEVSSAQKRATVLNAVGD